MLYLPLDRGLGQLRSHAIVQVSVPPGSSRCISRLEEDGRSNESMEESKEVGGWDERSIYKRDSWNRLPGSYSTCNPPYIRLICFTP